jgi:hypothetical protein
VNHSSAGAVTLRRPARGARPAKHRPDEPEHDEDVAGTTPVVQASAVRSRQEADPVAAWRTGTVDPTGGAGSGGGR